MNHMVFKILPAVLKVNSLFWKAFLQWIKHSFYNNIYLGNTYPTPIW